MKRFSETRNYIAFTEEEALKLPKIVLCCALYVEFNTGERIELDGVLMSNEGRLFARLEHNGLLIWDSESGEYVFRSHGFRRNLGQVEAVVFSDPD